MGSSSKQITVAVTGVSGDVGHGTVAGLRQTVLPIRLLAFDYSPKFAGQTLCDDSVQMPAVRSPEYVDTLIAKLNQHNIDVLFCGIDSEVPLLAENKQRIADEAGCHVFVAETELVKVWGDKLETARWLTKHNLPAPRTWSVGEFAELDNAAQDALLPLLCKPLRGHSSLGIEVLRTTDDLTRFLAREDADESCLQEYLPGDEFTCGLTFDQDGQLCDWIVAQRQLVGGRTMIAEQQQVPSIDAMIQQFGEAVRTHGAINIQLRLDDDGQPQIFEINPRMSGSTLMRVQVGYNDPARLLENFVLGDPIQRSQPQDARVLRRWATSFQQRNMEPLADAEDRNVIVFDCGGTLLNLRPSAESVCNRVLQYMGLNVPFEKIEEAYRTVDFCLKRQSSEEHSRDDRDAFYREFNSLLANALGIGRRFDEFHSLLYERCSSGILHWHPLPGVESALTELGRTRTLYVLANWDNNLQRLLERRNLADHFEAIYDSQTLGAEKPDPRIFERFCEQADVAASDAIYIGNEYEADIAGSSAAGFLPVLIDNTHRYSFGVDCAYCNTWDELTGLLLPEAVRA